VTWTIEVGGDKTTAVFDPRGSRITATPRRKPRAVGAPASVCAASPDASLPTMDVHAASPVFVCAHGAGGQMNDRSMLAIRDALTAEGLGVVRFNFLYRAKGSARPDPMPRLLACWSAVVDRVRRELQPDLLILGGRSMGGRAASMFVADGAACDGLLLLAYPLHPPGATDKLRADHLSQIMIPVLCFNGTRDAFCERPLMERVLSTLAAGSGRLKAAPTSLGEAAPTSLGEAAPTSLGGAAPTSPAASPTPANWRMHWLEDVDHGFHVLKRSGRTDADVLQEVARETRDWLASDVRSQAV
jgi:predicted alpha/beta-hydrolase family hydrolase